MDNMSERQLKASIAANERWGKTEDRTEATAPARRAMMQKFLDEAGGDVQRAENLRRAYFQRLALKSAVSRRKARELREAADAADAERERFLNG